MSDSKFINRFLIDTSVEQRFKLFKKGQVQSIARGLKQPGSLNSYTNVQKMG